MATEASETVAEELIISPKQIREARAILGGMTLEKLAHHARVPLDDLKAVEEGDTNIAQAVSPQLIEYFRTEGLRIAEEDKVKILINGAVFYQVAFVFCALVLGVWWVISNWPSSPPPSAEAIRREEIRHCFSVWDGSNLDLIYAVKGRLRDPASFEHIRTTYRDDGTLLHLTMEYRARNGFGGYSVEFASGTCLAPSKPK